LLNGWVLHVATAGVSEFKIRYLEDKPNTGQQNIHVQVGPDTYAYLSRYFTNGNRGYNFTLEQIEEGRLIAKLSAEQIVWDTAQNVWEVRDWKLRQLKEMEEEYSYGKSMDTLLSITPEDFDLPKNHHETLTLPKLTRQIEILEARGADNINFYRIEKYVRFMSPFAAIILTFIGVVVSSKKTRGGSGFKIALGFMLAFVYIILFLLSRTFAEAGSAYPIFSVWIPNIVFAITGLVLYKTVPRYHYDCFPDCEGLFDAPFCRTDLGLYCDIWNADNHPDHINGILSHIFGLRSVGIDLLVAEDENTHTPKGATKNSGNRRHHLPSLVAVLWCGKSFQYFCLSGRFGYCLFLDRL